MATTVRVCVTGAAGLIAYALVPEIAQGRVFGPGCEAQGTEPNATCTA